MPSLLSQRFSEKLQPILHAKLQGSGNPLRQFLGVDDLKGRPGMQAPWEIDYTDTIVSGCRRHDQPLQADFARSATRCLGQGLLIGRLQFPPPLLQHAPQGVLPPVPKRLQWSREAGKWE
jgi:hypothetical protein